MTPLRAHIDEPTAGARVDPLGFFVRGWLWLETVHAEVVAAEVWCGDLLVGSTRFFQERPDVTAALSLREPVRTGFEFYAHHPAAQPGARFELLLCARRRDGTRTGPLFATDVQAIERDYRQHHFGVLLDQRTTAIQQRANIFAEGPPQSEGSPKIFELFSRHLPPPPLRVLDVGCGLGSYGRRLLAAGYEWLGAEVNASYCAELARLNLPHRQIEGRTLPFPDRAFDAALCIEVLEHIADPRGFLEEVHRVAPDRLLVSVPNCELLSYLCDYAATPWHMLEGDHRNFFTRWSLGGLLREFYPHVEVGFHTPIPLRTQEGTPLHNHLFAIATG